MLGESIRAQALAEAEELQLKVRAASLECCAGMSRHCTVVVTFGHGSLDMKYLHSGMGI